MAKAACFILLVLLLSSLEINGAEVVEESKTSCIPRGYICLPFQGRRCCGHASCRPDFVCDRAPCLSPYICK